MYSQASHDTISMKPNVQIIIIPSRIFPSTLGAPLLKMTLQPTVLTGAPTLASVRVVYPPGQTLLLTVVTTATAAPTVVVVVCMTGE